MTFTTGPPQYDGCDRGSQIAPAGNTATKSHKSVSGAIVSPGESREGFSIAERTTNLESEWLLSQNWTARLSETRESTEDVGGYRSDHSTGSQTMRMLICAS